MYRYLPLMSRMAKQTRSIKPMSIQTTWNNSGHMQTHEQRGTKTKRRLTKNNNRLIKNLRIDSFLLNRESLKYFFDFVSKPVSLKSYQTIDFHTGKPIILPKKN